MGEDERGGKGIVAGYAGAFGLRKAGVGDGPFVSESALYIEEMEGGEGQ